MSQPKQTEDASPAPSQGGTPGGGAGASRPLFRIPSHREVEQSSRPAPPPNLFQQQQQAAEHSGAASRAGVSSTPPQPPVITARNRTPPPAPSQAPPTLPALRPVGASSAAPERPHARPEARASTGAPSTSAPDAFNFSKHMPPLLPQNAIIVNERRQKGNPILDFVRNVRYAYSSDIVPDFLVGATACCLYISVRYHLLHPDYLFARVRELQKNFRLRAILCYVDQVDVIQPLHEITKIALLHECTLICGFSMQECARYLETLKSFEAKPPDLIMERKETDYVSRLTDVLTSVRGVNKTDAATMGTAFKSFKGMMKATVDDLIALPGIGERKARRLYDAFHEPFRRTNRQLRLPESLTQKAVASQQSQPQQPSQPAAERRESIVPSSQASQ
eukprot:jgi/Chlat1/4069/Chrsp26S04112